MTSGTAHTTLTETSDLCAGLSVEEPRRAGERRRDGCILGVHSPRAPSISSLLVPLDKQMLDAAGIDLADFDQSIVKDLQVDGEQLAVPYDFGPLVLYYNVDRFAEAGISAPKPGWTVDDFLSAARALTKDGKYGFALYPTVDRIIPWSLSMTGAHPVKDGRLDVTQPGFAQAVQWYTDLVNKEKVDAFVRDDQETVGPL